MLIFLIVIFIIIIKTSPEHPLPNPRLGHNVSPIDYQLGNWETAKEDYNWYPGKIYDENGNDITEKVNKALSEAAAVKAAAEKAMAEAAAIKAAAEKTTN